MEKKKIIQHIRGNYICMKMTLTERTVTTVNGVTEESDSSIVPSKNAPVKVLFSQGYDSVALDAEFMNDGRVKVEDNGTLGIGKYSIEILCRDISGHPLRFKKKTTLNVVDATAEGGQYNTDEFDVIAYYPVINGMRSAIFIENGKIYLEVGGRVGEDDDPNDGKAMISTGYGEGYVAREDGKIILYI